MRAESGQFTAAQFQLKETLARKLAVYLDSIFLYQEFGSFLCEPFRSFNQPASRVIIASPCVAEIALSCDRANVELVECVSSNITDNGFEELKNQVKSKSDIIYLSNPNRLTGSTISLAQIKALAALVGDGLLIVDEYYFEFSRLSALTLLKSLDNLIILRAFENWGVTQDSESGFAMTSENLSRNIKFGSLTDAMDRATAQKCLASISDSRVSVKEVEKIQTRSLLIAKELTKIGLKCRLTPTDFVLIQTSAKIDAQKFSTQENIGLDLIERLTEKENVYRYRITATDRDFRLVEVLSKQLKPPSPAPRQNRINAAVATPKGNAQIKPLMS